MNNKQNNEGMTLLKRSKQNLLKVIFSRTGLVLLMLMVQVLLMLSVYTWFNDFMLEYLGGSGILAVTVGLYIISSDIDPTSKITWLVVMTAMPVFGALFFLYTKYDIGHRSLKKRIETIHNNTLDINRQDERIIKELEIENPNLASLAYYVNNTGSYPIFKNTEVKYFKIGEEMFECIKEELKKARKFIFLEFFIIDEGKMWGQILEILTEKVKEGVDVRLVYDGSCEFTTLPRSYSEKIEKLGIKCHVFSKATPFLSTYYNYRDHRKIIVIDNEVAYTGGINLADEYINHIVKHGHWKDAGILLKGDAVRSFTAMFLEMWNIANDVDYDHYLNQTNKTYKSDGYVMPYGDCPFDDIKVGEDVYIDILSRAKKYVHIMSPYLILDGEMEKALKFAAMRGVDVKLILPGIPDKRMPNDLAKSHYHSLINAGIEIYEYTPGFVHSKVFVSDDEVAVVGTINLDYRSLYHHFECATYLYKNKVIKDIEDDFKNTLNDSRKITLEDVKHITITSKVIGFIFKVFAPLM